MAASANPSGDNNNNQNEGGGGGGGVTVSNGNGIPVPDNYYSAALGPTIAALKHDPGITLDWPPDQDALMQELLIKYLSSLSLSPTPLSPKKTPVLFFKVCLCFFLWGGGSVLCCFRFIRFGNFYL